MITRSMRPLLLQAFIALALAGCGGEQATAPPPPPTDDDRAAGTHAHIGGGPRDVRRARDEDSAVSQLVSGSVELMTQSLHPRELARRTGDT